MYGVHNNYINCSRRDIRDLGYAGWIKKFSPAGDDWQATSGKLQATSLTDPAIQDIIGQNRKE